MKKQEDLFDFDNNADIYDEQLRELIHVSKSFDLSLFSEYKVSIFKELVGNGSNRRILEFGCGTGRNTRLIADAFTNDEVFGCDISEKSLKVANRLTPCVTFSRTETSEELAKQYSQIDHIFVSNVFHHIPKAEHLQYMTALHNIMSTGGSIIVFEHNPYNPATNYIFNHNEVDKSGDGMLTMRYLQSLLRNAGFDSISQAYTLFFPLKDVRFRSIEKKLTWCPLGAQYYVMARKVAIERNGVSINE